MREFGITREVGHCKQAAGESEGDSASEIAKTNKQTNKQSVKQIASIKGKTQESDQKANSSDNEMSNAVMLKADKPPIKTTQGYSINKIEVLQSLGNFTLASQYDSDEFLQRDRTNQKSGFH